MAEKKRTHIHSIITKWTDRGYALITGASSGIGASFALHLAQIGYPLILIARRKERLDELAQNLHSRYNIHTLVIPTDLADKKQLDHLLQVLSDIPKIDILINNAGFGIVGKYVYMPLEKSLNMIAVHNLAPVSLTYTILNKMIPNGRGVIINVASVAAEFPLPGNLMYCATKAFLKAFSQNIAVEYRHQGIMAQALCPGLTHTEFHHVGDYQTHEIAKSPDALWSTADDVVVGSLQALGKRIVVTPGMKHRVNTWLLKHTVAGKIMQKKFRAQLDAYYASEKSL